MSFDSIAPLGAILLGILIGYGHGLSLVHQARALTSFSLFPFIRVPLIALIAYYLLHWGTIVFILFLGTLLISVWTTLLFYSNKL